MKSCLIPLDSSAEETTTAAVLAVHPGVRYLAAAIAPGAELSGGRACTCTCVHGHTRTTTSWKAKKPTADAYSSEAACTLCPLNLPPRATPHLSHAATHVDVHVHTHTLSRTHQRASTRTKYASSEPEDTTRNISF